MQQELDALPPSDPPPATHAGRVPRLTHVFRAGLFGVFLLLLIAGERDEPPEPVWVAGGPSRVAPPPGAPPPDRVVRPAAGAPDAGEWTALERFAEERPVAAAVSGAPARLSLEPPTRLRAGRGAPLHVGVRGDAGEEVVIRLRGGTGGEDTLRLVAGPAGSASGAFVLHPARAGPHEWTLFAPGDEPAVHWSGIASPRRPLRILALSGPPGPEGRFAMRALEEAGEGLEAWIHLGRDLWVGRPAGPLPVDLDAYARFDAILVLPGLELAPEVAAAIERAVAEAGTGLLLAATEGASELRRQVGLGADWGGEERTDPEAVARGLPAEVPPPPAHARSVEARSVGEGGMVFRTGGAGRGRAAVLGVSGSWRWRMEDGLTDAHRDLWAGLLSWVAGGLRDDPLIELEAGDLRVGTTVRFREVSRENTATGEGLDPLARPPRVLLESPSGPRPLWLGPRDEVPWGWVAHGGFVPAEAGAHRLVPIDDGGAPLGDGVTFHVARPGDAAPDPEGRLARIVLRAPGGEVLAVQVAEARSRAASGRRRSLPGAPWLLAVIVLFAGAEWTLRRLRGAP